MIDLFYLISALFGLFLVLLIIHLCSNMFESPISKFEDYSEWVIFEFFNKNTITCLTNDWKNLVGSIVLIITIFFTFNFLYLLFSLFYGIYLRLFSSDFLAWVSFTNNFLNENFIKLTTTLIFMLVCWIVFGGYFKYYSFYQSVNSAFQYPQSEKFSKDEKHIAIVYSHYSQFVDDLFVNDCIHLLVQGFRRFKKKYKIYHVFEPSDFYKVYNDDKVEEMWILGHGNHGGLSYGHKGDEYIEYKKLRNVFPRKKVIIQLHCNCGKGTSLKAINQCNGYVSNYVRFAFQNRCYILNQLKEMKTKSESF